MRACRACGWTSYQQLARRAGWRHFTTSKPASLGPQISAHRATGIAAWLPSQIMGFSAGTVGAPLFVPCQLSLPAVVQCTCRT